MTESEGELISVWADEKPKAVDQQKALDQLAGLVIHVNSKPEPVFKSKKRRHNASAPQSADRWEEYESLIAKAARKAGANNYLFCKLLGESEVPVPSRWKVKTWLAAYNKLDKSGKPVLQASIRRFKSRHKTTS